MESQIYIGRVLEQFVFIQTDLEVNHWKWNFDCDLLKRRKNRKMEVQSEVNNCVGKVNEAIQDMDEMMETNCESYSEDCVDNCHLPENGHDCEHEYDQLCEIRIFIAGFRACVQETIRYLIEEEGLMLNDPFVISLQQYLQMQETMYILQCLGTYPDSPPPSD